MLKEGADTQEPPLYNINVSTRLTLLPALRARMEECEVNYLELRAALAKKHDRTKTTFETKQSLFLKDAEVNPMVAILRHTSELIQLQQSYALACDLNTVARNIKSDSELHDFLVTLLQHTEANVLEFHCWKSNSTCPVQNLVNQEDGKSQCDHVKYLRSLLAELTI